MNRLFWIDLIRVVSAFFVITIHTCGRTAGGYDESGETLAWIVSKCYHDLSHVAVPLFVMISGVLLLGRNEEPIPFYRKRFGKVLWPFLAWCCIYIFCRWLNGQGLADETPITLTSSVGAILSHNINGHFWFMYMLISLYLVAPFLSVFVRHASKYMLSVFLILCFFAVVLFPVINHFAKEALEISKINFQFEFVSRWVGFFIAGYVLKDCLISKRQTAIAFVLWFCLSIAKPVNVYLGTSSHPTLVSLCDFLGNYVFSIVSHQVVLSLLAFLVLRSLGDLPSLPSSRLGRMISGIAPLTFGIYLSHMLIVTPVMKKLALGSCESWAVVLFAVPILTLLIYLVTAVMVSLIRRIRYLRFLAP
ncbi:MAG: acyltransferase family protein [Planctomycetaceae bacterium]|nr:acyltransferase family protein [Planctomycetaceae bacterium]